MWKNGGGSQVVRFGGAGYKRDGGGMRLGQPHARNTEQRKGKTHKRRKMQLKGPRAVGAKDRDGWG